MDTALCLNCFRRLKNGPPQPYTQAFIVNTILLLYAGTEWLLNNRKLYTVTVCTGES